MFSKPFQLSVQDITHACIWICASVALKIVHYSDPFDDMECISDDLRYQQTTIVNKNHQLINVHFFTLLKKTLFHMYHMDILATYYYSFSLLFPNFKRMFLIYDLITVSMIMLFAQNNNSYRIQMISIHKYKNCWYQKSSNCNIKASTDFK